MRVWCPSCGGFDELDRLDETTLHQAVGTAGLRRFYVCPECADAEMPA